MGTWSREHLAEKELKPRGGTLRERGKSFVPRRKEESWMKDPESGGEREEDMGTKVSKFDVKGRRV